MPFPMLDIVAVIATLGFVATSASLNMILRHPPALTVSTNTNGRFHTPSLTNITPNACPMGEALVTTICPRYAFFPVAGTICGLSAPALYCDA